MSILKKLLTSFLIRIDSKLPPRKYPSPLLEKNSLFEQILLTNGKHLIKSFGEKNADRVFYVINRSPGSGFFSNLSYVLNHLKIADSLGLIPVVDMKNFPVLYNEKDADLLPSNIQGITNAWEYYFKPVSPYSLDEVYESKLCIITDGVWPKEMTMCVTSNPSLTHIYDKYIRVEDEIDNYVTAFYKEKFAGKNVLGIHFRGGDQITYPKHSFPPTEAQMLNRTKSMIATFQFDLVFISTEEQGYLDMFRHEFGDIICSTESYRTYRQDIFAIYPRSNHRYLLGREILQDMLLLSKCSHLLCGDSNVSELARLVGRINGSQVNLVENGKNSSNPLLSRYLWYIKRYLPEVFGGFSKT